MAVDGLTEMVRFVSIQTARKKKEGGVGIDGYFVEVTFGHSL
jgi:hypothetical protein